jgi:hypothetical protein
MKGTVCAFTDDAGRVVSRVTFVTALRDAEVMEMDADQVEANGDVEYATVIREEANAVREAVAADDTPTLVWFYENGFLTSYEVLDPAFEGGFVHEWIAAPVVMPKRVFYPTRTVHGRVAHATRARRPARRRSRASARAGPSRLADDPDLDHLEHPSALAVAA